MLKQRVITAVILLALLLPALFADAPYFFNGLTLVLMGAAAWEWARMQGIGQRWSVLAGIAVTAALWLSYAAGFFAPQSMAYLVIVLALCGPGIAWMLWRGMGRWSSVPRPLRLALGWAVIALAWLAVVHARAVSLNFLLSVLVLVWAADIAAYFGGRAWGVRKLAPQISPGKTWAGAISGAVAVLLIALAWGWADTRLSWDGLSVYSLLWQRWGWGAAACLALLVALSITGDLVESLVKRVAGVKDSSGLLPGHGGVLDRVDALLPVLPMAVVLVS